MNSLLSHSMNKSGSPKSQSQSQSQQLQQQLLMSLQQQQKNKAGSSSMSLFTPNPSAREARIKLDSKKSFCDDQMFYPEQFSWSNTAINTNALSYIPGSLHSQGLATYNQRVSQHANLGSTVDQVESCLLYTSRCV